MKKEDFWKPGTYPDTPADNRPQPSDNVRWEQLIDYYRRRDSVISKTPKIPPATH